jgi:hypothetical protein
MRLVQLAVPVLLLAPAAAIGGSGAGTAVKPMVVPFIEDDYDKALAEARARKLPIFIDTWAPW